MYLEISYLLPRVWKDDNLFLNIEDIDMRYYKIIFQTYNLKIFANNGSITRNNLDIFPIISSSFYCSVLKFICCKISFHRAYHNVWTNPCFSDIAFKTMYFFVYYQLDKNNSYLTYLIKIHFHIHLGTDNGDAIKISIILFNLIAKTNTTRSFYNLLNICSLLLFLFKGRY